MGTPILAISELNEQAARGVVEARGIEPLTLRLPA